eukprot:UN03361
MLCNLFNHVNKSGIRVLSVVTLQEKVEFTFVEILEPVTNSIHLLLAFFRLQRTV